MKDRIKTATLSVLLFAGFGTPAVAGTLLISDSVFEAAQKAERHPARIVATLHIPDQLDSPLLCVYYSNTTKKAHKGWVRAHAAVQHQNGDADTVITLEGRVSENKVSLCEQVPILRSGDFVTVEMSFAKMPRLRSSPNRTGMARALAVIAQDLTVEEFLPALQPCPDPDPPPQMATLITADSVFEATQRVERHPTRILPNLIVPTRLESAEICVNYSNTVRKANKGRIQARAAIQPQNGDAATEMTFSGAVEANQAILCQQAPTLEPGDLVAFDVSFKGMPRLRNSANRTDRARISAVVSQDLTPAELDPAHCPDPSPDPNWIPSNIVSAADQAAVSRLLNATLKTQLWRYKGDKPTKWTVTGPKTRIVFGGVFLGNVDPATTGYGNTIAAAVADYEKKMGPLRKGAPLTPADVKGLEWYSGIDSRPGPTAVRRDINGPFYGEYYRQSTGVVVSSPLRTIAEAIAFLKAEGL
ncbi:MAG: hypothetical protein OEM62_00880 [Acidobacteriota bacterium]|nr:hypothetical protein [Acidobacteriota bacterium]